MSRTENIYMWMSYIYDTLTALFQDTNSLTIHLARFFNHGTIYFYRKILVYGYFSQRPYIVLSKIHIRTEYYYGLKLNIQSLVEETIID